MTSLKEKTIKGIGWSFTDNVVSTGITFLTGLILARILSPEEFGILGMIAVFIAVSNTIVESGFSSALIRKNDATNTDYNTVFYFNLLLGIVLYVLLFICSPAISRFFNEPILIPVTRVMGILLIINAFGIIQRTILTKKVDFKTQTKISLIASLTSGGIGIGMAVKGLGVWSLVGQQVSRQLLNSIFLWVFNKWRPVLEFSKKSFKDLFGFGSKLLASGLIDTIYRNIFYLIIGKFYQADKLGQYTRAEGFKSVFSSNLTGIVQRVSFPVLSSIQDDANLLRQAYRRVIKTTMLITFTCMLGLAAVAHPLITVLIGEKWLPAAEYLQIICFAAMLYPLHAINLNMLQVKGRSDLFLRLEIIKKIVGILPIFLGIFLGIKVMLWGSVFTSFVAYFLNSKYSGNLISYPVKEQIKDILPSFIIALSMAILVFLGGMIIGGPVVIKLVLLIALGILLIFGICEISHFEDYLYIKQLVKERIYSQINGKKIK
jgi:O-antigen/teichoic acid export membrane protein